MLLCEGADRDQCLTAPQVKALKVLYAGAITADGKQVWPGYLPGGEEGGGGWSAWIIGPGPGKSWGAGFVKGYFTDMVYSKPDLDVNALSLDDALSTAMANASSELDAVNPDLGPFRAHGGKLILYHGWNDPAISAMGTVDYYNEVVSKMGAQETEGFVRLFMVPGMQHCSGGPGLNSFGQGWSGADEKPMDPAHNIYAALEQWVDAGTAPEQVIAAHVEEGGGKQRVTITRPLCAYPKEARYDGKGNRKDAKNYVCAAAE